jgi:hypothetical protein
VCDCGMRRSLRSLWILRAGLRARVLPRYHTWTGIRRVSREGWSWWREMLEKQEPVGYHSLHG